MKNLLYVNKKTAYRVIQFFKVTLNNFFCETWPTYRFPYLWLKMNLNIRMIFWRSFVNIRQLNISVKRLFHAFPLKWFRVTALIFFFQFVLFQCNSMIKMITSTYVVQMTQIVWWTVLMVHIIKKRCIY